MISTKKYKGYKTKGGVEVRTMGQSMRPVIILVKGNNELKRTPMPATLQFELNTDKLAFIDDECNEIIPNVTKIELDVQKGKSGVLGRLQRVTSDEIHYLTGDKKAFARGYMRVMTENEPKEVSEPIFVSTIKVLEEDEFDKVVDEYHKLYLKNNKLNTED